MGKLRKQAKIALDLIPGRAHTIYVYFRLSALDNHLPTPFDEGANLKKLEEALRASKPGAEDMLAKEVAALNKTNPQYRNDVLSKLEALDTSNGVLPLVSLESSGDFVLKSRETGNLPVGLPELKLGAGGESVNWHDLGHFADQAMAGKKYTGQDGQVVTGLDAINYMVKGINALLSAYKLPWRLKCGTPDADTLDFEIVDAQGRPVWQMLFDRRPEPHTLLKPPKDKK